MSFNSLIIWNFENDESATPKSCKQHIPESEFACVISRYG